MVDPSPFDRLLQQANQLASRNPSAAYEQLEFLFGKTCSDADILHLGAFAGNLGGAGLGRFEETIAFIQRLLDHAAIEQGGNTWRSLHRALAVLNTCIGNDDEAQRCREIGATNASEHGRVAAMCAQTLAARGRSLEAVPHLKTCAALCQELADNDEVMALVADIGANISRHAGQILRSTRELLLASTGAALQAWQRSPDWQTRHKGLFQMATAHLHSGQATQALSLVQQMMTLENGNQATDFVRFFTASVACQAQIIRGQMKIAAGAYGACRSHAAAVNDEDEKAQVDKALNELTSFLETEKQARKAAGA